VITAEVVIRLARFTPTMPSHTRPQNTITPKPQRSSTIRTTRTPMAGSSRWKSMSMPRRTIDTPASSVAAWWAMSAVRAADSAVAEMAIPSASAQATSSMST
jgi:hypothetical protein